MTIRLVHDTLASDTTAFRDIEAQQERSSSDARSARTAQTLLVFRLRQILHLPKPAQEALQGNASLLGLHVGEMKVRGSCSVKCSLLTLVHIAVHVLPFLP